jgi:hypothetical protein
VQTARISLFAAVALSSTALLASVPTPGHAQDDLRERGNRACRGDAPRLCKKVIDQGDMVILSCFQQNRDKLSATCRKFLTEVGQLQ